MLEDIKLAKGMPVRWHERQVEMYRKIFDLYPDALPLGLSALASAIRLKEWNDKQETL